MNDGSKAWSWRHAVIKSELCPTTRHVLLTISCYMNDVGGGCYPTTKDLAAATGLSERAVCTHIAGAAEAGWLKVSEHGFRGQKWKNHEYQAAWPKPEGTEGRSVPSDAKALNVVPKGTERRSKKALNVVQSTSPEIFPDNSKVVRARARERDPDDGGSALKALEQVLDESHARAVIEHRAAKRARLTPYAAKLLAKKFSAAPDPNAAADAMIENGWQGFDVGWLDRLQKGGGGQARGTAKPQSLGQLAMQRLAERGIDVRDRI